ncbi:hypothetical protein ZWY2020_041234 [Hordeum vulgare]|nr:hypothetical protein ZWY2020_041234 [Hordeum vulgare]
MSGGALVGGLEEILTDGGHRRRGGKERPSPPPAPRSVSTFDVLLTFLTAVHHPVLLGVASPDASPTSAAASIASRTRLSRSRLSKSANSSCNEVLIKGSKCCVLMARLLNVYNQAGSTETFVSRKERFVIGDGMTIKSASTSSLQSLPQTFGYDGIAHGFEEVQVSVTGRL